MKRSKADNAQIWLNWALGFGIAAFVFATIGIMPVLAVAVNIKSWSVQAHVESGTWKVIVGTILSVLALLGYLSAYGHL